MDGIIFFIFEFAVFIFSVMIHEVSHGAVAERLGDPTARLAGRLTLNPLKHIDPFGSVILPLILALPALFGAPVMIFGWAKPVPYDPRNLKDPRGGGAKIAVAGPLSNLILALAFAVFMRIAVAVGATQLVMPFGVIVYVNLILTVFNLLPFPPLDGSRVAFAALARSERGITIARFLEQNGFMLILLTVFFGFGVISTIAGLLYILLTGQRGF